MQSITGPTNGGSCATVQEADGNQMVTCHLGTMPPAPDAGSQSTITILVEVDEWVPDGTILYNQAIVYSDIFDPDTGGNIATEDTPVGALADLSVVKDGSRRR